MTRITINGHELSSVANLSFNPSDPLVNEGFMSFDYLCKGHCKLVLKPVSSSRRPRFIKRSLWFSIPRSANRGLEAWMRQVFKKSRNPPKDAV